MNPVVTLEARRATGARWRPDLDVSAINVPLPDRVQIEPVGPCKTAKPPALMSFEAFCRVLDQFPHIGQLHLQGAGEPFLHPRLLDMVRYAAVRGVEVATTSSLTTLSSRRAEELVASGLARLHVSIDAAGSTLPRVLRSLAYLQSAKKRAGASRPEIVLVAPIQCLEGLPRLVQLAAEYGVRSISVQEPAHEDAVRVARELGIELRLPPLPRAQAPRGCDRPWRGAYVTCSGQAMPCSMVPPAERPHFGNMAKAGVMRVWNGEDYNAFRARLASDDPPDICKGCAVYNGHI